MVLRGGCGGGEVRPLAEVLAEAQAEYEALPAHVKEIIARNRLLRLMADAEELGKGLEALDSTQESGYR